jgi:hypothetical protein
MPGVASGRVMERSTGAAGLGAVAVLGGAEYVRSPRLPKLPPLPGRASAAAMPINARAATAAKIARPAREKDKVAIGHPS